MLWCYEASWRLNKQPFSSDISMSKPPPPICPLTTYMCFNPETCETITSPKHPPGYKGEELFAPSPTVIPLLYSFSISSPSLVLSQPSVYHIIFTRVYAPTQQDNIILAAVHGHNFLLATLNCHPTTA